MVGPLGRNAARWKINNHGWNSDIDYDYVSKDTNLHRIAVIGDSYVEALNVNPDENFIAYLRSLSNSDEVYSFGIGGSPFSQYLHFARYADMMYDPDLFIILLTKNDFDESLVELGDFRNLLLYMDQCGQI